MIDLKPINPRIPLPKRGGFLSVQASEYHYCTPKHNKGPYYTYEVAYWTDNISEGFSRLDELGPNYDDVYAHVDKADVVKILESEGFSPFQIKEMLPDE